jgi:cytochrome oxidase Cu insertion factor (SCO1/SenC/PrrC family)
MRRLLIVALAFVFAAGISRPADARDHLNGIVLMTPTATSAVVHHDAFGGMPSMTMTFSVPPGTAVHPGDHISADVDTSSDPWKLSSVRVTAGATVQHSTLPKFLNVGDQVPDIPLVDQTGRHETLAALRGEPYALTFIYTRCRDPKMCPFVSAKLHQVQSRTAGTKTALVEVSLDPAYDRPPVLARYAKLFGADPARWHLFTGDPRTVLDFAARFRILERSAGADTIVHSERLAIVNAGGRITQFYDDARWNAADVAAALR